MYYLDFFPNFSVWYSVGLLWERFGQHPHFSQILRSRSLKALHSAGLMPILLATHLGQCVISGDRTYVFSLLRSRVASACGSASIKPEHTWVQINEVQPLNSL